MINDIKVELDKYCNPDSVHGTLDDAVFISSVGDAELKSPAEGQDYKPYARLSLRIALAGTDHSTYIGIPVSSLEDAQAKQAKFEALMEDAAKDDKLLGIGGRSVRARVWSAEMDQKMTWKLMGKGLETTPDQVKKVELSFI